jgi:hypothetical protein
MSALSGLEYCDLKMVAVISRLTSFGRQKNLWLNLSPRVEVITRGWRPSVCPFVLLKWREWWTLPLCRYQCSPLWAKFTPRGQVHLCGQTHVVKNWCLWQGCQRVCFQTNLGKFWRAFDWKVFIYFMAICNVSRTLGIFYDLGFIWYIFSVLVSCTKINLATLVCERCRR